MSRITPSSTRRFTVRFQRASTAAGTVEIWDNGTYELLEEKRNGNLTFRLHGERLNGTWSLVPAHMDGKEQNWLLIKRSDDDDRHRGRARDVRADARDARHPHPVGRRLDA